jgi:hypothetical protein
VFQAGAWITTWQIWCRLFVAKRGLMKEEIHMASDIELIKETL